MGRSAEFSECHRYRYSLHRVWSPKQSRVLIIGLNPSTADHEHDDPTIRRCIKFAQNWGHGGLCMANLFAYRSTNPAVLKSVDDPVGPDNDEWLKRLADECALVVAAWGNEGAYLDRSTEVREMLGPLSVLKINRSGEPAHPLYLKSDLQPMAW